MSGSRLGLLDLGLIKGVDPLVQRESRSAIFGAKVAPSLQRADPSFMNSVTAYTCRANCSNILQDIQKPLVLVTISHLCPCRNFGGLAYPS